MRRRWRRFWLVWRLFRRECGPWEAARRGWLLARFRPTSVDVAHSPHRTQGEEPRRFIRG